MKSNDNKEVLVKALGEEKAEEVLKLTINYDKYILKFKKAMNKALESSGYEVKAGLAFTKKEK